MRFFSSRKNLFFDNNTLLFSKQDCVFHTLLAFFILLLPLFSLFSHTRLLLAGAMLILFYIGIRGKESLPTRTREIRLYFLFFATVLAGIFKAEAGRDTAVFSLLMLAGFLPDLYIGFRSVLRYALALSGGIFGALAVLEHALGRALSLWSDGERFGALARSGGIFGNPNILGAFLSVCAVFALDMLLNTLTKGGWSVYALSFVLSLSGLLLTFSRGAWMGAFFSLCFYFWHRHARKRKKGKRCLSFAPFFAPFLMRALSVFSPDSSMAYRFSLWKSIFSLPASTLLFGVGEGKTALLTLLSPRMAAGLEKIEHTHSLFFHILTAEGMLGLILFLSLLICRFTGKKKDPSASAALLSLLFYGIFDDPLYSGQIGVLFWMLLGAN